MLCSSLSVMTGRRDNGLLARRGSHTDTPSIAKHPCAGGRGGVVEETRGGGLSPNVKIGLFKNLKGKHLNQSKQLQQVLDQV